MNLVALGRRIALGGAALVYLYVAVGSLLWAESFAEPFDYTLATVNAKNEWTAIYVGLWVFHAVIFTWAIVRIDLVVLGDVCGLLVLGQVAGRLLSFGLHGLPDARLLPPIIGEIVGAVLILSLRPSPAPPRVAPVEPPRPDLS